MKLCLLTVSDTRTKENDESGKWIQKFFAKHGVFLQQYDIVTDERKEIEERLTYYADHLQADIIFTTGGTGFSPRDITPEATKSVVDKEVPGISEYLRMKGLAQTNKSILSRGFSGIRKQSLIINLPGSVNGVSDAVEHLFPILFHAVEMLKGKGH